MPIRQLPPPDICLRTLQCACRGFVDYEMLLTSVHAQICPDCLPIGNTIRFNTEGDIHFSALTFSLPKCYQQGTDGPFAVDVLDVEGVGTSPEYGTMPYRASFEKAVGAAALDSFSLFLPDSQELRSIIGSLSLDIQSCNGPISNQSAISMEVQNAKSAWIPLPDLINSNIILHVRSDASTEFAVQVLGTDFLLSGDSSDQKPATIQIPESLFKKLRQNRQDGWAIRFITSEPVMIKLTTN